MDLGCIVGLVVVFGGLIIPIIWKPFADCSQHKPRAISVIPDPLKAPAPIKPPLTRRKIVEIETEGKRFLDRHAEAAIKSRRVVWIKYCDEKGETSERKVNIYCSHWGKFHGFCHQANDERTFRRDRVQGWKMLEDIFEWDPQRAERLRMRTMPGYWSDISFK